MTLTFAHSWPLPATPERVFTALTNPADLMNWFAEGAMVEPKVGGVYRFWGRHTLFTPPEDAARQTISHYQPVTRLGFNWPLNEVDTNVILDLAPNEAGTTLTLTHRVSGDLLVPRQKELIEDHWRLAIANLTAYLAGTPSFTLPDYFAQAPRPA
ncbi:MAG: activator of hsp90 atpase 1 family protein [Gemmatimonadetes bacterium]|nr:activator of hsp90 atpase 1 family protein [Gemmatimonadota bacterium]